MKYRLGRNLYQHIFSDLVRKKVNLRANLSSILIKKGNFVNKWAELVDNNSVRIGLDLTYEDIGYTNEI